MNKEKINGKGKKGQVNLSNLPQAALSFVVFIAILGLCATVLEKYQNSQDTFGTASTVNESLGTVINGTSTYTVYGYGDRKSGFAVQDVYNNTNFRLEATGYTFTDLGSSASFVLKNNTHNNSVLKITYTNSRSTASTAYNITARGNQGLLTFSQFSDPIGVIIAAVVIIGLIMGALMVRRGSPTAGSV